MIKHGTHCLVFFVSLSLLQCSNKQVDERPNVLLVSIDTLRADHVGCYGYPRATSPTMDSLAQNGTRFAQAYSNAPITTPSHYNILTGTLTSIHGSRDNLHPRRRRNGKHQPLLSEIFSANGWQTAAFVSGYPLLKKSGLDAGFHTYDDHLQEKLMQHLLPVSAQ